MPGTPMSHDQKKKPGIVFWITVVLLVMLAAYPLSFGPACWIACRSQNWKISTFYWPVQSYVPCCPGGQAALAWYAKLGMPTEGKGVLVPFHNRDGELEWVRYSAAPPHGIPPGRL